MGEKLVAKVLEKGVLEKGDRPQSTPLTDPWECFIRTS